jgi:hypothetical protein
VRRRQVLEHVEPVHRLVLVGHADLQKKTIKDVGLF